MKEKKSTFSWIFSFAGQKKSGYIASVILAVIGAAFQILPFFVMAQVIGKLLAGNKDLAGYLIDCAVMAAFWLLRVLFHLLSTAQSHKATFAVLGNIRKQGLAKLAKMPLGDVQAKGSGELKNILVERVDSIEPTLAHAIPEMSSNAAVALATLIYLFVIDWRMALASLITFPLGMVFFMLMMAGYEKNYARTVAATNTLNDTAVEYIGGIEVIKAFGKAKNSYEKFVIAAKECAQSYIDWMNKSNFYFTFAMNIMPATLLSVLPIGGLLLKNGTLTPEKFVLIVILSMGLITPIIGCMKFTDDLAKVKQVGTKTEQGRYSSKYALTELLICGECGTPYRRCTWAANGKKKVVWRCINRLDYGKKYCHDSPSIEESVLQEAIMKAVMQTARQNAEVLKTLKLHIGMGLSAETTEDNSLDLQIRIAEIEAEFQKMLKAIAADNVEAFDEEKAKALMDEKAKLQIQLDRIADTKQKRKNAKSRLDEIFTIIEALANHPISYDDQIVRQILESVIVESKEKIKVVFVGGLEVTQTM